ncbi:MAG: SRPBCC family protein [Pseudomonadota bacterium]
MAIIDLFIDIHAPQEDVYRISQDYAVRFEWDPFPDRLEMLDGASYEPARGNRVYVRSRLGMAMVVEFVQVDRPARAAVAMVSGPWFIGKFAGSWIFEEREKHLTRARFRYLVQARPALLRMLIDPVAALYFRQVVQKRLYGLKRYCERATVAASVD